MYQNIMLAKVYKQENPSDYAVSEKLDGVRAIWDGKRRTFLTRQGKTINAPEWFTSALGSVDFDGELFAGRGKFDYVSGAVRRVIPNDIEWKGIEFHVFDIPNHPGRFVDVEDDIIINIVDMDVPHIKAVKQYAVGSTHRPHNLNKHELDSLFKEVVNGGGEGLMLRSWTSVNQDGRSSDLLKYKPHRDAEAVIVGYTEGKGKYIGLLGALIVQMPDGTQFNVGSGLTDYQRMNPPAIGTTVTYNYMELTKAGVPRQPTLARIHTNGKD
jgi:DNA ligase-1